MVIPDMCFDGISLNNESYFIQDTSKMSTTFTARHGFGENFNGYPYGKKSEDGKTLSWYHPQATKKAQARYQNNTEGRIYHWFALG